MPPMTALKSTSDHFSETEMDIVQPERLRLDASTFCQLKCPTCETATGELHKRVGAGFLRFENFKRLVDENPWVKEIELSNFGEIFLNPQLSQILEHAHSRGVRLTVQNGANLNTVRPQVLEDLVRYRVQHIRCSIDGASQDTYAQYRIKGDFDTVISNIRRINEFKSRYGSDLPRLTWQFVVFGHNEHELEAAQVMAAELGMDFIAKLNWDETYSPVKDKDYVRRFIDGGVASRSEFKEKRGANYMDHVCHQLWDNPQINFDGTVWGCCRNHWQAFDGNAFGDGLTEALNSEQMIHARAMLLGEAEARDDIPCASCRLYQDMVRDGRKLER